MNSGSQTGEGRQWPWHCGEAACREPWRDDCHYLQGGNQTWMVSKLFGFGVSYIGSFNILPQIPTSRDALVINLANVYKTCISNVFWYQVVCVMKGVWGLQWRVLSWSLCPLWLQPSGQTWYLSKILRDRSFGSKNFTQKTSKSQHQPICDKRA